jgi:hypothetical protein
LEVALVVSIIKGETSIQEAARQHGITVAEIEDWQERFLLGAEKATHAEHERDRDHALDQCEDGSIGVCFISPSWTSLEPTATSTRSKKYPLFSPFDDLFPLRESLP